MEQKKLLEEAPIRKLLVSLCIPTVVIMLVMVVYNMADIYFIGQTGDTSQISAISMSTPVFTVLQALGTLLGGGGCIAVSMALGAGDHKKVKSVTGFCCFGALVLSVIFAVGLNLFLDPILRVLGASQSFIGDMRLYVRILSVGAPVMLFSNVFGNVIRADGSAKEGMVGNLLGTAVNIILDPLFILVFHMGIAGAAIATVLGNLASSAYLFLYIKRKKKIYSFRFRDISFKKDTLLTVPALGLPLALSTLLMSFSGMFSNRLLAGYGDIVIAAQGVSSKVGMLIGMLAMGICMGVQPAISYNYGAGRTDRMKQIIRGTGFTTVAVGTVLTAVCLVFRNQIVAAFVNDAELISYGRKMVVGCLVTGPVLGLYQLATSFLQATGKVTYASLVSVLRQGLIYIPVLISLNAWFGLDGLIYSGAAADVISILIAGVLSIRWYRDIRKKMSPAPSW